MKIPCGQCGKKFWQTDGYNPPRQKFCSKSCGTTHSAITRRNYNRQWMKEHRKIKPVAKKKKRIAAGRCPHCEILIENKHDCLSPVKF